MNTIEILLREYRLRICNAIIQHLREQPQITRRLSGESQLHITGGTTEKEQPQLTGRTRERTNKGRSKPKKWGRTNSSHTR